MNKNQAVRNAKVASVKTAISYLHEHGIQITNRNIASATKELFPDDKKSQVDVNLLSNKEYYKLNLKSWIKEITGEEYLFLNKARELAKKSNNDKVKKKFKRLEKYADEFLQEYSKGKFIDQKITKSFVYNWIKKTYPNESISPSIFSDSKYEVIYVNLLKSLESKKEYPANELNEESSTQNDVLMSAELVRLKEENKNLIKSNFIVDDNQYYDDSFVYFKVKDDIIQKDKLFRHLKILESSLKENVEITEFISYIIEFIEIHTSKRAE